MEKYPAYKSIKGTFYEQLPCDWNQLYLKQVCSEKSIKNTDNKETNVLSLSYGRIIKKKNINSGLSPKDFATYQIIKPNDIILRLTDLQNDHKSLRTGISEQTGIITSAYTCLTEVNNSRFLHYTLHAMDLNKVFYRLGSGVRQSLNYGDIRYLPIPAPSMHEQQQIVRYLDWKTSQINHLIHGYERLISLLEERKTAVINEAVTKGVRNGVTLKDSGVEWLGKVPAHWEINRAKWLFKESKERRHDDDEMATASQKYGIILQKDFMEKEQRRIVLADQNTEAWKHVEPNDFVISLRSFQGGLEMSKLKGCVTWHYIVLKARKEIYPEYYKWLFKSKGYVIALQRTSDFIRDGQDLRYTNFEKVSLPYLPLVEQKEIAEYIEKKLSNIEFVLQTTHKQIEFLRERRTRLISDVVTGALDVRDVVVPEYAPEQDMEVTEDGDEYEGERA